MPPCQSKLQERLEVAVRVSLRLCSLPLKPYTCRSFSGRQYDREATPTFLESLLHPFAPSEEPLLHGWLTRRWLRVGVDIFSRDTHRPATNQLTASQPCKSSTVQRQDSRKVSASFVFLHQLARYCCG